MSRFTLHERFTETSREFCSVCCEPTTTFFGLHFLSRQNVLDYARICRDCVTKMAAMFPGAEQLQAEIERLQTIVDKLHPRILKLLEQERAFIVIGIHENYYPQAYMMIREQERIQGSWTADCEDAYQEAIEYWHELQCEAIIVRSRRGEGA